MKSDMILRVATSISENTVSRKLYPSLTHLDALLLRAAHTRENSIGFASGALTQVNTLRTRRASRALFARLHTSTNGLSVLSENKAKDK